jgi:hypothetical protein
MFSPWMLFKARSMSTCFQTSLILPEARRSRPFTLITPGVGSRFQDGRHRDRQADCNDDEDDQNLDQGESATLFSVSHF